MGDLDPRFGRVVVAYPDPTSMGWGGVVGGGVTLAIGLLPFVAVAFGDASVGTEINGDMIAGVLCIGSWNLLGLLILVGGVRDLLGKPEWLLCEHAAVLRVRGRARKEIVYRSVQGAPQIVERRRNGTTVGHHVNLGREMISVPSMEVAQTLVSLWAASRGGA